MYSLHWLSLACYAGAGVAIIWLALAIHRDMLQQRTTLIDLERHYVKLLKEYGHK